MHLSLTDKHDATIAHAHALADKVRMIYAPDEPAEITALLDSNANLLRIIEELATRLDRISEYVKMKGGEDIG